MPPPGARRCAAASQTPTAAATTHKLVRVKTMRDNNRPAAAAARTSPPRATSSHRAAMSNAVAGASAVTYMSTPVAIATVIAAPSPAETGSVQRRAMAKTAMQDKRRQVSPNRRTARRDSPNSAIHPASMKKSNGGLKSMSATKGRSPSSTLTAIRMNVASSEPGVSRSRLPIRVAPTARAIATGQNAPDAAAPSLGEITPTA